MIYTNFGTPLTITGYCGKHQPKGFKFPVILARIRHEDDGSEGFYFPINMKADGGIQEIDAAMDAAPEVTLEPKMLKAALAAAV